MTSTSTVAIADNSQELIDFVETLITIGVISPEKADLARSVIRAALSNSATRISKELKQGMTDPEVLLLQKVLNSDPNTVVATSGNGSSGHETTYFGPATKTALIKFQNLYNFEPTGITDEVTRAKINAILSIVTNVNIPEAQRPSVDLKVNGQDDNVQIGHGGTATIIWTSHNVTSCVSGGNQVKPVFGTDSITNVVTSGEFVMTCVGPNGLVSDSVTMTVISAPSNNTNNTNNGANTVVLGSSDPADNSAKSVVIQVNGASNYSTTSSAVASSIIVSWGSVGFSDCKATTNPILTGFSGVTVPTSGYMPITFPANAVGTETFTIACATGTTAVATLNQNLVSSLSPSANLMISSATLNISNYSNATTTKSLGVTINGKKNYATSTLSSAYSPINPTVSWVSTGFTACRGSSSSTVASFYEKDLAETSGSSTMSIYPSMYQGTTTITVACATGTAAIATLNQNMISSLTPSANLMIATSTLFLASSAEEIPPLTEAGGSPIAFGGQVMSISECTNKGGDGEKLYAVVIQSCSPGSMIGTSKAGSPVFGTGYITFRENNPPLPSVGDSILGGEVPDESGICQGANPALSAPWIGDASGPLGTGPACMNADGTPVNPANPNSNNNPSGGGFSPGLSTGLAIAAGVVGGVVCVATGGVGCLVIGALYLIGGAALGQGIKELFDW